MSADDSFADAFKADLDRHVGQTKLLWGALVVFLLTRKRRRR